MVALSPVPSGSTVDAVLDQLQRQVSGGSWPVGERIPGELDLAAQLGVSRPAVREAIRALSHCGVLEVRRGDGTYVRSSADPRPLLGGVAHASARDVFEVQLAYDVQAARLAARRRTAADLERLEELLRARDEATGADEHGAAEFGAADARFHLGVAEASGNPVLIEAMRFFIVRLGEAMRAVRLDHEVPEAGPARHRAVLDAIIASDPDAAARAAAAVVEPTLAVLDTLLAHPTPPPSDHAPHPAPGPTPSASAGRVRATDAAQARTTAGQPQPTDGRARASDAGQAQATGTGQAQPTDARQAQATGPGRGRVAGGEGR
ncbi:FadR/GntR family transcriptional regulator [Actinomadura montaniterrae]|uniref:FCD domain-containing protein n=1 Tax=Actinomadura montaniterrae TaxID=1803903 RepID=A0A6L3W367_9ACTN|nr:FCD domain-containing protein [Actinomadura montaniterrae]KAB2382803.1 FCD domain-containing protein [Actinomadura montaniterrae]